MFCCAALQPWSSSGGDYVANERRQGLNPDLTILPYDLSRDPTAHYFFTKPHILRLDANVNLLRQRDYYTAADIK